MHSAFETHSQSGDEEEQEKSRPACHSQQLLEAPIRRGQQLEKECLLDPARELPNKSYSLEPDMANGWRPKRSIRTSFSNVFPINYHEPLVDQIVKELYRNKGKGKDRLVYLGPRRNNSYLLHEDRTYSNPYPLDKKLEQPFSPRHGLPLRPSTEEGSLTFDSDFESGNLDAAVQRGPADFDLFMRVDTNTRGHTNWFYFSVSNGASLGKVRFKICNFRREKSLYQRGLKPYVTSKLRGGDWQQEGTDVRYGRQRPQYAFLYGDEDEWEEHMED